MPGKLVETLALTCFLSPGERIFPWHTFLVFACQSDPSSGLVREEGGNRFSFCSGEKPG